MFVRLGRVAAGSRELGQQLTLCQLLLAEKPQVGSDLVEAPYPEISGFCVWVYLLMDMCFPLSAHF